MSSTCLFGRGIRLSVSQGHNLSWAETSQQWVFALLDVVLIGVLVVDLDHAADEKLFFFGGACLPVVRLVYGYRKTLVASPLFVHGLFFAFGGHVHVVLNLR
jgi:hypothetical protein